jgi:hypothetical protein
VCSLRIGGFRISDGHCGWAKKLKKSVIEKIDFQDKLRSQKFQFFAAGAQMHF